MVCGHSRGHLMTHVQFWMIHQMMTHKLRPGIPHLYFQFLYYSSIFSYGTSSYMQGPCEAFERVVSWGSHPPNCLGLHHVSERETPFGGWVDHYTPTFRTWKKWSLFPLARPPLFDPPFHPKTLGRPPFLLWHITSIIILCKWFIFMISPIIRFQNTRVDTSLPPKRAKTQKNDKKKGPKMALFLVWPPWSLRLWGLTSPCYYSQYLIRMTHREHPPTTLL